MELPQKFIGYQISERLALKPIELYAEVTKREKLACARCTELVSAVAAIGALYELERQACEAKLMCSEREALRAQECPSWLAALRTLITKSGAGALPKSALGKACTYSLNQWERLERYAGPGHGMVEIDNNWAENAMRGVALGRKNWIQIGRESAGPKVAALLSVLETSKRLKLNAREYLQEVLPVLA